LDPQTTALTQVKQHVTARLDELHLASSALCAAAPGGHGWSATADRAALDEMKRQWKLARVAYEQVEGALAVLFPDIDVAIDERYDGFVESAADPDLFDGQGVTGMHAIERILWSDATPAEVVAFEQTLGDRYVAPRFPADAAEAAAFRAQLCAQLVGDVGVMRTQFRPLALDTAAAFRGVIGSMEEQLEKTTLAATGQEESRYSQVTLADMRANLAGAKVTWDAFRPWLVELGQRDLDARVQAGFSKLAQAYAASGSDTLPRPPSTWSSATPTAADLATPFGQLFTLVKDETDPGRAGSLVAEMNTAAEVLGIPQLPAQ
jgi:iron uptake system component EfeO